MVKVKLSPCHEDIGRVEVQLHALLILALVGGKWSASHPGHFNPGEGTPDTHWIGGWVGSRASPDVEVRREKSHH